MVKDDRARIEPYYFIIRYACTRNARDKPPFIAETAILQTKYSKNGDMCASSANFSTFMSQKSSNFAAKSCAHPRPAPICVRDK